MLSRAPWSSSAEEAFPPRLQELPGRQPRAQGDPVFIPELRESKALSVFSHSKQFSLIKKRRTTELERWLSG